MAAVNAEATERYLEHRDLLMGIAYRMLGRTVDAEDVIQDTWLRWMNVQQDQVDNPRAFLVRIATRLALDRLRRIKARREAYVGEWLPEPLLTVPDAYERVELVESISMAMLVVMETLSPLERAVFVLNEAFGIPYPELSIILGRSAVAVRQIGHRARRRVEERRPRFNRDTATRKLLTDRFLAAAANGDVQALLEVLAPGVTLVADGGGMVSAPLRPVSGVDKVSRFLLAVQARQSFPASAFQLVTVNGGPGIVITTPDTAPVVLIFDVHDGAIQTIYLVSNPSKLAGLRMPPAL